MKLINKMLILLLFGIIISITMVESIALGIPNAGPSYLLTDLANRSAIAKTDPLLGSLLAKTDFAKDLANANRSIMSKIAPNLSPMSVDPSDIHDPDFPPLNTEKIVREITMLNATELKTYRIILLSNEEIMLVLQQLTPSDLLRVLIFIPLEDLKEIKYRLTDSVFNQILDMVGANRNIVEYRFSPATTTFPATNPAIILP